VRAGVRGPPRGPRARLTWRADSCLEVDAPGGLDALPGDAAVAVAEQGRWPGSLDAFTDICVVSYILGAMAAPFAVLAEPHRRRILDLLLEAERPVGELVAALSVSQPAVSKHLRVLREAGLVDVRVDAQRRIYRVRSEPLQAVDEWLAPYRRLWAARLDALERHLDEMEPDGRGGRQ
jgi:DNA-binding transcriptional ArsR family regulator